MELSGHRAQTTGREPAPRLPWSDRLILGGRMFVPAGVLYILLASALVVSGYVKTTLFVLGPVVFLHIFFAFLRPHQLLQRGEGQRALDIALYQLSSPFLQQRHRHQFRANQVESLLRLGRLDEARALLDTVSRWPPKGFSERAQLLRVAVAWMQAGDPATAVELLERVPRERWKGMLRRHRDLNLAAALSQLGRSEESRQLLEDALAGVKLERRSARLRALVWNNRAVLALDLGEDAGEALEWARQAAELVPEESPIRSTLGAAIVASGGDPEEALTNLAATDPEAPPVAVSWTGFYRGLALERLGRLDEARQAYRHAAEQGDWPGAQRAAKRLAELGGS